MLVQVAMFPTDKAGASVSADVAQVIALIDKSGLPYKVTAMATILEGEWKPVMKLLNRARKLLLRRHSRVYITMAIDDRKDAKNRLTGKVRSIERRLGKTVNK